MTLKYSIPFDDLYRRALQRRIGMVNNTRYRPKTGRFGVPASLIGNSIQSIAMNKWCGLTKEFAAWLEVHKEHIQFYWPAIEDHSHIVVVIDHKHSRPIATLFAEFLGITSINREYAIKQPEEGMRPTLCFETLINKGTYYRGRLVPAEEGAKI